MKFLKTGKIEIVLCRSLCINHEEMLPSVINGTFQVHSEFPQPLSRCLGCVLRVTVLLEGEPLAQAEVPSALQQVFIKLISILYYILLFPNPFQSLCRSFYKRKQQKSELLG